MHDEFLEVNLAPPAKTVNVLRHGSWFTGIIVIAIALLALAGWVLDIDVLISVVPGRVSMKPNTALGLIANSTALLFWHRRSRQSVGHPRSLVKQTALILAVGVCILGLLTLLEYSPGLDLGIDQLIFEGSPDAVDATIGGRPAPNTAITFMMTGSASWLLLQNRYRAAQGLSAAAFFSALLALTGHLYSVTDFYQVGSVTGMAVQTAIAFLLLALGILLARTDQGWMRHFSSGYDGGIMMRRMLPLMIVLPTLLGFGIAIIYDALALFPEGAFALRSVLGVTLFSAVIWWNGRLLNQLDAQRETMQRRFTDELEAQVATRTAELRKANQTLQAENARRQQVEASLRASETRTRRAIQFAPFPIVIHAEDGEILAISQTLADITGYSAAEIPTITDWTERAYGERRAIARAVIDQLYHIGDRVQDGEFAVQTKTGETCIWDFSSAPLGRMADGRRLVISMAADITRRKQMETELAESRVQLQRQLAELETIYQSAPIGLNVLDRDLRFVRINQRLADINGYSVEAHIGRTVQELLPDLADTAEQLLRPVLATGEPLLNVEIRGETPAQPGVQRIWCESFLPLKEGDRIIGINTVCEEITEQRRTQLALQAARFQLEAALEAGAVYPWQLNFQENRVITNRYLAELFGLDPAAATTGFSIEQGMNIIHEGDRPQVEQVLQTAIATGKNYQAEFRICPLNREEKWVLSQGKVNLDAEGNPSELVGVVVDITGRKQMELAQRESETRYRTLFETIQDGFCIVEVLFDPNGHPIDYYFVDVNPAFEQQTGLREAAGKTALELVPGLESHWAEIYGEVVRTGQSVRFDNVAEAINRWFEVHAFPLTNQDSTQVAVLFREVSDRKRAEAALAERAAQQAIVAKIGQQALAHENLDAFLHWVIQRVAEVLHVEYCKLLELLPNDQGFLLRAGIGWQDGLVGEAIVPGGRDSQAGYTLLTQEPIIVEDLRTDGRFNGPELLSSHGVISGMSTVIGDIENHPFGVIGVHTRAQRRFTKNDVNFLQTIANILAESIANHQSKQEIRRINASLERRVEERTEQLVEVNQELESFAYSVSHDLRAPLRAIEGLARIFQEDYGDRLDEAGHEYTQMLIDSAAQMDGLIRDLLSYSRLGRRDIQLSAVDLGVLIPQVWRELGVTFNEPQPQITLDESLPVVLAQRTVLRQVIANLLTNAVKFVEPGTIPTLHIWAENQDGWVQVWVEDNGVGIAPRHQERIFRPFERLFGIEQYPGTGIGLAIVQRGIARMGGQVGVESTLEQGSRFWFRLRQG
ncbi:PAS domain-containing sensor histidine kinase [Almyronema epifaneia]|uniref:histidine kinase n=1 Tax=Almyronema epifaneia S1 TaxID=2991925 RepID=A0ABW6ID80_9CYAN